MTDVAHDGYIPRNAVDHISPFFSKGQHSHSHSHHRHQYQTPISTPVPRRLSAQIDPSSFSAIPTTAASVASSAVSYNTPPATPPLNQQSTVAEPVAWCTARARIPTPDGSEYFLHIYENTRDKKEHLAFVFGDAIRSKSLDKVQWNETEMDRVKRGAYQGRLHPTTEVAQQDANEQGLLTAATVGSASVTEPVVSSSSSTPLVRIHSECFTGEIGHSARCDCGEQLDEAIRLMKAEGSGVVVYLRQEGRGIGLAEKLK